MKINIDEYIKNNSWKEVAKDWSENLFPIDMDTEVIHRLQWTLNNVIPEEKIVDIGSNKGHIFYGLDRRNITSVDIDEYDIPNFVRADATKLPFEDKQFDKAFLGEILEHSPDPVAILKEAYRVAKKLVITVPYEHEWLQCCFPFETMEQHEKRMGKNIAECVKETNPTAKDIIKDDDYKHLYHQKYYTPETLKEDLDKAGITNYKITKLRHGEWAWLGVVTCE